MRDVERFSCIQSFSVLTYEISSSFCPTAIGLIKFTGDQGVDSTSIPQDPDLDADDDDMGIVDERLGLVHSAIKLACIPGTLLSS